MAVYEWLSGDCPFKGTFEAITRQHFFAPPPPLRKQQPDLPAEVEHVVMRALAKEVEQRFPDIEAFAQALQQAAGIPQSASPEMAPRTTKRQFMGPRPFSS